ncbi:MAG: hypothetical protein LBO78_02985 [Rickettsiales bacterium]|jgi:hypothetical protein|nr:hypothetical protein [Rickettsiales bacterium]
MNFKNIIKDTLEKSKTNFENTLVIIKILKSYGLRHGRQIETYIGYIDIAFRELANSGGPRDEKEWRSYTFLVTERHKYAGMITALHDRFSPIRG